MDRWIDRLLNNNLTYNGNVHRFRKIHLVRGKYFRMNDDQIDQ